MCVGPSDSGKTTWVEPILAILDDDKVVAVTDEGKFSTQLLQSDTQLLMMDEWSPGKRGAFLECDLLKFTGYRHN